MSSTSLCSTYRCSNMLQRCKKVNGTFFLFACEKQNWSAHSMRTPNRKNQIAFVNSKFWADSANSANSANSVNSLSSVNSSYPANLLTYNLRQRSKKSRPGEKNSSAQQIRTRNKYYINNSPTRRHFHTFLQGNKITCRFIRQILQILQILQIPQIVLFSTNSANSSGYALKLLKPYSKSSSTEEKSWPAQRMRTRNKLYANNSPTRRFFVVEFAEFAEFAELAEFAEFAESRQRLCVPGTAAPTCCRSTKI